jgi:hypothetical protein
MTHIKNVSEKEMKKAMAQTAAADFNRLPHVRSAAACPVPGAEA